jgi:hypothetical protein
VGRDIEQAEEMCEKMTIERTLYLIRSAVSLHGMYKGLEYIQYFFVVNYFLDLFLFVKFLVFSKHYLNGAANYLVNIVVEYTISNEVLPDSPPCIVNNNVARGILSEMSQVLP